MAATHPISVRLTPEVDAGLRRMAHRTRRPLTRVINDLLDRQLRMERFPGISFVEQPVGPCAHVAGTGLDVWELVSLIRSYDSPEELLKRHTNVTQQAINTALAYAAAYPDEIEAAIAENERSIEDVVRDAPFIRVVRVGS